MKNAATVALAADNTLLKPWIDSEVQPLEWLLLAKPHRGLQYLSTANYQQYLFDNVPDYEHLCEQYETFMHALESMNIRILFIDDLLQETLTDHAARCWLLDQLLPDVKTTNEILRKFLLDLDANTLSQHLIEGVTGAQLLKHCFTSAIPKDDAFIFHPLVNHFFTRDTSIWIHHGVVVASMKHPVRQREALIVSCIYRYHPWFNHNAPCKIWFDGAQSHENNLYIEGGDILFIDKRTLLIGHSERSSWSAIQTLATTLLNEMIVEYIMVLALPQGRDCIHLDMMLSMVDHHLCCLSEPLLERVHDVWKIWRDVNTGHLRIEKSSNFLETLKQHLNDAFEIVKVDTHEEQLQDGQANCATNLLTIKPGTVISYEHNDRANLLLSAHGVQVIVLPGTQLMLGHGGPHCMSCPVSREAFANGECHERLPPVKGGMGEGSGPSQADGIKVPKAW